MSTLSAPPSTLTRADAVRFLQRATFGPTPGDVDDLLASDLDTWFSDQTARTMPTTHLDRRVEHGNTMYALWEGFLAGPDQLRKRVGYALSQIFVASDLGVNNLRLCAYADLLETHAFGTYRALIEHVTRSPAMGQYLTYDRNRAADPRRGSVPDENYAREIMQLFSIGLWELQRNGERRLDTGGQPIPTYDTDDILGLARVFTGFESQQTEDPYSHADPMRSDSDFSDRWHERGEKRFLGTVIPASETRTLDESLAIALDALDAHPNTPPFISRQLIQRLVTSNPTPAYVERVVSVWEDDGSPSRVRGNLAAVVRAILLDDEAWTATPSEQHGKLREPVLRFTLVTRALDIRSTHRPWPITSLSDSATELGQQPYESPSVFNFYRPGYVPPQSPLGDAGLVAPEMQLHNETAAIGWVNYITRFLMRPPGRNFDGYRAQISFGIDDLVALIAVAEPTETQAASLVDELAARLCPFGLSPAVRELVVRRVRGVVDTRYDHSDETTRERTRERVHLDRVMGAASLIAASTDFLHER